MPFTHTNKVVYTYSAGGVNESKTISLAKTGGAEINLDTTVTLGIVDGGTAYYDIPGFEFADASTAISTHFRLDGVNGKIYANGTAGVGATFLMDLDDGVPAVWSVNGSVSHPLGTVNPFSPGGVDTDAIESLSVRPDAYDEDDNPNNADTKEITLKVRVLYDPA